MSRGPQGEVRGNGPQVPADLEAQGGAHVDNHNPSKTASILGYVHRKPPDLHRALHLALPLGKATDPADAHADAAFLAQRTALALPVLPGQVHLGDAANDVLVPYRWMHDRGGIAVCDDNPHHEPLEPESLLPRGSDQYGTPSAPGGRVCHSNGEDYQAQSRQDVCGRQWPPAEPQRCPHRHGVRGYSHRRMCTAQPRLIGPIQRGPPAWQRLYEARSASERTNRYAQEVIANGRPLRMRGRKACRFAGAIRTLAQRLRRARTCARCHLYPRQGPRGSDLNDTAL